MANEIAWDFTTGLNLYIARWQLDGDVFLTDGSADETFGTAGSDIDTYDVALTETATGSKHYLGSFDAGSNIAAGVYRVTGYQRAGANPANTDEVLFNGIIDWDGTAEKTITTIVSDLTIVDSHVDTIISDLIVTDSVCDTVASDLVVTNSVCDTIASDIIIADSHIDTTISDLIITNSVCDIVASDMLVADSHIDSILSDSKVNNSIIDTIASDLTITNSVCDTVASDLVITNSVADTVASDLVIANSNIVVSENWNKLQRHDFSGNSTDNNTQEFPIVTDC